MKLPEIGIGPVLLALLLTGCKNREVTQPVVCQQPTTLVAQAPCESGYADVVVLKASGYARTPDGAGSFDYDFYAQKDTLSGDLTVSSYATLPATGLPFPSPN